MSKRNDYEQVAAKTDHAALVERLEQLGQQRPPRKRKTITAVLGPHREQLLSLHRLGYSYRQLSEELKTAGIPVSPGTLRDFLCRREEGHPSRPSPSVRRKRVKSSTQSEKPTVATQLSPPIQREGNDGQRRLGFA